MNRHPRRFRTLVAAVGLLLVASATTTAADPLPHSGELGGDFICRPYTWVGLSTIAPDGTITKIAMPSTLAEAAAQAASDRTNGRVYAFALDGTEASRYIQPAGWLPLDADARQLRLYGLPPRPRNQSDHAAQTRWTTMYGHITPAPIGTMCENDQVYHGLVKR